MGHVTRLYLKNITVAPQRRDQVRRLIQQQRKTRTDGVGEMLEWMRLTRQGQLEFRAECSWLDGSPQRLPEGVTVPSVEAKWPVLEEFAEWACRHFDSGRVLFESCEDDRNFLGWEFQDGRIRLLSVAPATPWLPPERLEPPRTSVDEGRPNLILSSVTSPRGARARIERFLEAHRRAKNPKLARFCRSVAFTEGGTLEFSLKSRARFETNEEPCEDGFVTSASGKWDPFETARLLCHAGLTGTLIQGEEGESTRIWDFRRGRIRCHAFGPTSDWERLRPPQMNKQRPRGMMS